MTSVYVRLVERLILLLVGSVAAWGFDVRDIFDSGVTREVATAIVSSVPMLAWGWWQHRKAIKEGRAF